MAPTLAPYVNGTAVHSYVCYVSGQTIYRRLNLPPGLIVFVNYLLLF